MGVFAVVENNIVVNVIVADNQEIANEVIALTLPNDIAVPLSNEFAGIGWGYIDGEFIPPTPDPIEDITLPTPDPIEDITLPTQ
jgi:hypothetical protein